MKYKGIFLGFITAMTLLVHAEIPANFWAAAFRGTLQAEDVKNLTPYEHASLQSMLSKKVDAWKSSDAASAQKPQGQLSFYASAGVGMASAMASVYAGLKIVMCRAESARLYQEYVSGNPAFNEVRLGACDAELLKWMSFAGTSIMVGVFCMALCEALTQNMQEHELTHRTFVNLQKALEIVEASVHTETKHTETKIKKSQKA